jgi:hypothetical protein
MQTADCRLSCTTISRGYVNLLPPWYFKMTLSYIIHVLVLYQGDAFVCRFEIGPHKEQQYHVWPKRVISHIEVSNLAFPIDTKHKCLYHTCTCPLPKWRLIKTIYLPQKCLITLFCDHNFF